MAIPTALLVVANAAAGSTQDDTLRAARAAWDDVGVAVDVVETGDPGDLDDILAARGDRRLVVLGGDGSIHAVVGALHRGGALDRVPVGLVPLGTGNDLARGVGLPLEPDRAARVAATGRPTPMDLLVDDRGGIVVNAVNIGVGAEAAERASDLKDRLGRAAYPAGAALAGVRASAWTLQVEVDGIVLTDGFEPALHVIVANGANFGGGTVATPDARPGDGRIDVMVSLATGPLDRVAYAAGLARGEHTSRDDVRTGRGVTARVHGDEFPWNVDGELQDPTSDVRWTMHAGAWSLIT